MVETQRLEPCYEIPFKVNSKLKPGMHLLFIIMIVFFLAFNFIPLSDIEGLILKLMSGLLVFFFIYMWLFIGIFRSAFVELDSEGIIVKTAFGTKRVLWADVVSVNPYVVKQQPLIGLITRQKLEKQKDNLINTISILFTGIFSLSIPLRSFPDINCEKLICTMQNLIQSKPQAMSENYLEAPQVEGESLGSDYNYPLSLFKALLFSIITGIIYGASITVIKVNILLIPIICAIGIMYLYFKGDKRIKVKLFSRIVVGLLCSFHVIVAMYTELIILNKELINQCGILKSLSEFTKYIFSNPMEFFAMLILIVALFFIGITYNLSIKFMKNRKKHDSNEESKEL